MSPSPVYQNIHSETFWRRINPQLSVQKQFVDFIFGSPSLNTYLCERSRYSWTSLQNLAQTSLAGSTSSMAPVAASSSVAPDLTPTPTRSNGEVPRAAGGFKRRLNKGRQAAGGRRWQRAVGSLAGQCAKRPTPGFNRFNASINIFNN